jgi:ATP-binding cassette, subfamily B, bacterial PglK
MNNNFQFLNFFGFKKFLTILEQSEKKNLFFLFLLMIIASFLEMLSIGIIIPLINFLLNPENTGNDIFSFIPRLSSDFLDLSYINFIILTILFVYILKNLFIFFYTFFSSKVILKLKASISKRLFAQYLKKDYLFHLNNNSALLIRNIQSETSTLINSFVGPFLSFWLMFLTTIFILILLFYYSFISSLIVLFIFGIFGILLNFYVKGKLKIIGETRQKYAYGMLKHLQQGLALIKEIKLLSKENFFLEKFNIHNFAMVPLGIKRSVFGILPKIMYEFIFIILALSAVYYVNLINVPFEKFFAVFLIYALASFRIMPSLNGLSVAYQKIKFGLPALELILNESEKIDKNQKKPTNVIKDNFNLDNDIELNDVSFSYSDNQKLILDKINLKIKKNTCIGIVGDNAAGKSTLVNLICGLTKPQEGKVLVDAKSIFNDLTCWQKLIGFIPQSIYLLDDSVQNNIAIGVDEKNIDKEKVKKLTILTGLSETLAPEDLVGEGGKNISGGQKQKIGIARALYNEPKILIYDEPTSAMDIVSEEQLTETIFNQVKEKTLIIISHRPRVLKYCDFIYKLENKKISLVDLKSINLNTFK